MYNEFSPQTDSGRTKLKNIQGITSSSIEKNENAAKDLLIRLANRVSSSHAWLYGSTATALDAHVVCFIARMCDVNRHHLVPQSLKEYAARAMKQVAWNSVMQGRGTMVPQ
jgi:glutathione S-transferase